MVSSASFSKCREYRWKLTRFINHSKKELIFIGLNPSIANENDDDPTLRRLVDFANLWGYGSLTVLNLFAKISKSPELLKSCKDPVGSKNDFEINKNIAYWSTTNLCDLWLGWGVNGKIMTRNNEVLNKIKKKSSRTPYIIGLTKDGHPRHPLYISKKKTLYPLLHRSFSNKPKS